MQSIFQYSDYRCFLKDKFSSLKEKNPRFSYRAFNRQAGIASSGFLKLVIEGQRNLGEEGIQKISKGFNLNEEEFEYFNWLVRFNQAESHQEKDRYFRKLMRVKPYAQAKSLQVAQYNLLSKWYYVAILELVRLDGSELKDLGWIQQNIKPTVGRRLIHNAIKELQKLGLLEEDSRGEWKRNDQILKTPDEVKSLSLVNFHKEMSQLAARAVAEDPSYKREFSALTIAVSEEGFDRIKKELQKFLKKLHGIIEQEEKSPRERVCQVNLQLFQLSQ